MVKKINIYSLTYLLTIINNTYANKDKQIYLLVSNSTVIRYTTDISNKQFVLLSTSMFHIKRTYKCWHHSRKARKGTPNRILLNLCISLICLLILLYIAEHRSGTKMECRICNVFRYYFALVSLMWNAVEAHTMYRMLIKVFNDNMRHFVFKAGLVAWGTRKLSPVHLCIVLLCYFVAWGTQKLSLLFNGVFFIICCLGYT